MTDNLPDHIKRFLREAGSRERVIARCTMETRLYHDLGVYGDEALDYLEVLAKEFGVELSPVDFDKYFPREFPGRNQLERFLFRLVPRLYNARRRQGYEPVTLSMIDRAIRTKLWPS